MLLEVAKTEGKRVGVWFFHRDGIAVARHLAILVLLYTFCTTRNRIYDKSY